MGRKTATPIKKQVALTKRQQLNMRSETARYASMTAKRLALFSAGLKSVKDKNGNETLVELGPDDEGMNMAEIRAAEIILRKTMPDLQSVHLVEEDEFSNLTRDELETRLKALIEKNPKLAIVAGIMPKPIEGEAVEVSDNNTSVIEGVKNHGDISEPTDD